MRLNVTPALQDEVNQKNDNEMRLMNKYVSDYVVYARDCDRHYSVPLDSCISGRWLIVVRCHAYA